MWRGSESVKYCSGIYHRTKPEEVAIAIETASRSVVLIVKSAADIRFDVCQLRYETFQGDGNCNRWKIHSKYNTRNFVLPNGYKREPLLEKTSPINN
jgi:hypothetical protein